MPDYEDEDDIQGQLEDLQDSGQAPSQSGVDLKQYLNQKYGHQPQSQDPNAAAKSIMSDYMNSQTGNGLQKSDLADALRAQQSSNYSNNLGRAFNTIGTSIGTPNQKVDQSFFDTQDKQATQPVNMLLQSAKLGKNQELSNYRRALQAKALVELSNQDKRLGIQEQGLETKNKGLGLREDVGAANAANAFDKDPILQQSQKQMNQVGIDYNTLKTTKVLTPEIFDELSNGLAGAIAGGRVAAQGTVHAVTFNGLDKQLARLSERIHSKPEDVGMPEVKEQMADIFNRLHEGYRQVGGERAKTLSVGREYAHNPSAAKTVKAKADAYANMPSLQEQFEKRNPGVKQYSSDQEMGIQRVMKSNGIDRDSAVKALEGAGMLK